MSFRAIFAPEQLLESGGRRWGTRRKYWTIRWTSLQRGPARCWQGEVKHLQQGEESRDGEPGQNDVKGIELGGATSSVVCRQPSGINGLPAGQTAPVRGDACNHDHP